LQKLNSEVLTSISTFGFYSKIKVEINVSK